MRLGGLQKMTLLDFPGRVACTVFTVGCNFRCPFCHNSSLVLAPQVPELSQDTFFAFLEKRRGLLDGVAITGGEPMLHPDLPDLMRRIRSLGFAVKLDTNGSYPDRLATVLDEGLADYVAMDVKNSREKYEQTAGVPGILPQVERSVRLLMDGRTPFEFRTTLVDELHEPEDFTAIGRWIGGDEPYFIQGFVDSGDVLAGGMHAANTAKALACLAAAKAYLPNAALRGIDEKKAE